jgi:hypothetical protein
MDPRGFSEAGGAFNACLELLHPEVWQMVKVAGLSYTHEAIELFFLPQHRNLFEALSKPTNIEALRDAARTAKFNVKLKSDNDEVLIQGV